MRDALRASIKEAARAAASSASRGSAAATAGGAQATPPDGSPRSGSGLLWALLRNCLRQQGEALIDLQASRAAAKDTEQQLRKVPVLFLLRYMLACSQASLPGLLNIQQVTLLQRQDGY